MLSLDRTKLAGNAAQKANRTLPQIGKLLAEAAAVGAAEDARYGDAAAAPTPRALARRAERPRAKANGCSPAPRTTCASYTGTARRANDQTPPPAAETKIAHDRERAPYLRFKIRTCWPSHPALCDRLKHAMRQRLLFG
jgi:hypothetical protein